MRLRCKSCGAQIEARDVNLAALKASCPACSGKFHFSQEDTPALGLGITGEAEMPKPRHIQLEDDGETLVIRRSWREGPLDWMFYVLLGWYALLGLGFWQISRSMISWQQTFQLTMLLIVLAVVGALGVYALLQGMFNSTVLSISPRAFRVSHGPIRISRKRALDWDFESPSPQIRQIYTRMSINPSSWPSVHGAYDLHVILHSGVHEVALHGLPSESEAVFLCQQIRRHLNLPRTRIEQRNAPEQVPRPEKIEVAITPNSLTLIYRFGTLLSLSPALIAAVVGLITLLVLLATSALEARPINWLGWPIAPMTAAEILLLLCILRLGVRRRIIRVDETRLWIEERPASVSRARCLDMREVWQFYCAAQPRRLRPPWRTGGNMDRTYEVWAIDNKEARTRLIAGLPSPDEAFFIEQEIERHLGMEDAVVKGEITRPGSAKALDLQKQLNQRHDLLTALRLEANYTQGRQYPATLPQLLQLYQSTDDESLLEEAAGILQLPSGDLERVMWEIEQGNVTVPPAPAASSPPPESRREIAPGPIARGETAAEKASVESRAGAPASAPPP